MLMPATSPSFSAQPYVSKVSEKRCGSRLAHGNVDQTNDLREPSCRKMRSGVNSGMFSQWNATNVATDQTSCWLCYTITLPYQERKPDERARPCPEPPIQRPIKLWYVLVKKTGDYDFLLTELRFCPERVPTYH
jgi:hypothetical protein